MELLCDSCNYVIGEVGYMGPKRLFKLFVHRSDVCFTESPKLSIGLSQTVTKEFIDHAAAHALYHFIIEERKSCEPVALVSMTAWNTDIMAEHENGTASGRVIKVTYVDRKGDGFAKKIKDTEANGSAEHIIMLNDDCDELLKTLEANSLYYPPPFHMMPGGTCSFLHM
ncbi:hypothetical protein FBU59_003276 [Linderina macrospora]|uniref:Uncharacterized protein n=1 Tax=Linderina macrospora TaxID=4868 RepID=A0ACC1J8S0_9FUNG|nr:hypothetical protein FBU59_003276 [Linderina macrospora]